MRIKAKGRRIEALCVTEGRGEINGQTRPTIARTATMLSMIFIIFLSIEPPYQPFDCSTSGSFDIKRN